LTIFTLVGGFLAVITLVIGVVAFLIRGRLRRQAERFGYASVGQYLSAAPGSDAEKREAVNMALQGVVICILGLLFPPFLLIGLFPLFFGARKVAWGNMGLGLVDDADHTSA